MFDGKGVEIDIVEAADIDGDHLFAPRGSAFAEGMNATGCTEAMFDGVPVEGVGGKLVFSREQMKARAWHEPHQHTLARTDGTITGSGPFQQAFHLEGNFSAVAAS